MSENKVDILSLIRKDVKKKETEGDDVKSFLKILTEEEKEQFLCLTLDTDKEEFINKIMLSRAGALQEKIKNISIDKKIAKDIMDVTSDNLRELLRTKKTEELEKELSTGMSQIKREYLSKYANVYVVKRNKRKSNGELDYLLNPDEHAELDNLVERKLCDNPSYKFSLLVINNASGTIDVFNDKIVESRRDYEINKLVFCNEKGMTPESFDEWQEHVRITIKNECIDEDGGFSNLQKFDDKWHKDTFKKFYKKFPGFVKGETLVYSSEFLDELEKYDDEMMAKTRKPVMVSILREFDAGMIKLAKKTEEDTTVESIVGVDSKRNTNTGVLSGIELRKRKLDKKKEEENKVPEIKEDPVAIKEPAIEVDEDDITKFLNLPKQTEEPMVKEVIVEDIQPEVKEEVVVTEIPKPIVVEEPKIESKIIHETITNPDQKLKVFRSEEVETDVLVKFVREPDINVLRNINDPKLRMTAFKNSAVPAGFKIYLPYSGFEVIIKKLMDKSHLSYIYSMIDRVWDRKDLEQFIEQETLKIIFNCLEFPNFEKVITFRDFIKNLSVGDIPILMIAFAMTNIPEDDEGRIKLGFKSIKCTNTECGEVIPLTEIKIDLKDLFSKIYPYNKYKDLVKRSINYTEIDSAYRSTNSGELHSASMIDDDGICKYTVYYSKPTVYKDVTVETKASECNFDMIKEDIIERKEVYKELYGLSGLDDYLIDMSFESFQERSATLAANLSVTSNNADEFTEFEFESISKFIKDNMSQVTTISKLLETNYIEFSKVFNVCKFIDMVHVQAMDGTTIIKLTDCQGNLFNTIQTISQMPVKLVDELVRVTNELGTTYKFEHDNVFYTSDDIKSRIDKEFLKRYSKEDDATFIEYLKNNNPGVTQEQINMELIRKEDNFKKLSKGHCTCGNDTFFLNYMTIVFFSIFKR